MLHHLSFGVSDIQRSAAFYDAVFAALAYVRVWERMGIEDRDIAVGYGYPGGDDRFAIKLRETAVAPGSGFHLAFAAPDRDSVDRFHAAALRHGGVDNGSPGLRPHYGPHYYACFVTDPDGYQVEAVIDACPAATIERGSPSC